VRCFLPAVSSPSLSLSCAKAIGSFGFAAPRPKASLGFVADRLLTPPKENWKPPPLMMLACFHTTTGPTRSGLLKFAVRRCPVSEHRQGTNTKSPCQPAARNTTTACAGK